MRLFAPLHRAVAGARSAELGEQAQGLPPRERVTSSTISVMTGRSIGSRDNPDARAEHRQVDDHCEPPGQAAPAAQPVSTQQQEQRRSGLHEHARPLSVELLLAQAAPGDGQPGVRADGGEMVRIRRRAATSKENSDIGPSGWATSTASIPPRAGTATSMPTRTRTSCWDTPSPGSTMTVCAVPSSSMHRHGSRCGMESGPLNLSYALAVRNSSVCPRGRSSCGRETRASPPLSTDAASATEASVPSPVWSVHSQDCLALSLNAFTPC